MNKHITILYLLASLMFVTSCQKELPNNIGSYIAVKGGQSQTTPDTPTSELKVSEFGQFEAKGGEFTITVTASGTWTANKSRGSDWLTISPESGKAGTTNVVLKATENTAAEPRTATISLLSGDITKNVEVTQVGANQEISLDTSNMEFTSVGGSKTFKISTNTSWTVTSDQTWCSVSPESGKDDGTITVKVTENTSASERTAMITVKSDIRNQTVKVIQGGAEAALTLSANSIDFTSDIGSQSFMIISNTLWTISSDKTWCTVSPTSGNGDGGVTVSVDENTSTSSRMATIMVESATITRTLAVTQNGATPVTPPASQDRTFTVGNVTFKMIAVEGGTFTMGATSEQGSDADSDEKPTHSVMLSSYSIGETEVTQSLWQAVMGQKPTSDGSQWSSTYGLGGNYPAYNVNWNDCQEFIRKLNALTGENFRLPTEAEWEYAARGGNKSRGYKYAGSNNIDDVAWYSVNSYNNKLSSNPDYGTHNVATKSPNELGLYDMSGNVWEWCSDWFGSYSSGSQTNPTGPSSGSNRVGRGGSWYVSATGCRVSLRNGGAPDDRTDFVGLRLAL